MASEERKRKSGAVSIGNWLWTLLLSVIPVVNLIYFIVCAITSGKTSKRNWAMANLILIVAVAAIVVFVVAVFGESIATWLGSIKLEDLMNLIPAA